LQFVVGVVGKSATDLKAARYTEGRYSVSIDELLKFGVLMLNHGMICHDVNHGCEAGTTLLVTRVCMFRTFYFD
jgi:hypothetical protein